MSQTPQERIVQLRQRAAQNMVTFCFMGLLDKLKDERDAARAESVWNITCIDHTDKERAAVTCPCCLRAKINRLESELALAIAIAKT